jgi:hypothetical protein
VVGSSKLSIKEIGELVLAVGWLLLLPVVKRMEIVSRRWSGNLSLLPSGALGGSLESDFFGCCRIITAKGKTCL